MRALGFLGGTFNPVHIGHLRGALDCVDQLGLDQVALLPAAQPPLKDLPVISAQHRSAMLELAVQRTEDLTVDCRELDRPGLSFTIDTVTELRHQWQGDTSLTFIMGLDSLVNLHHWRDWQGLFELCNIAVLARPGAHAALDGAVRRSIDQRRCPASDLKHCAAGAVTFVNQTPLDVSSTAIRGALKGGKNVQFLLPEAVIEYIVAHELYDCLNTDRRGSD